MTHFQTGDVFLGDQAGHQGVALAGEGGVDSVRDDQAQGGALAVVLDHDVGGHAVAVGQIRRLPLVSVLQEALPFTE